MGEIMTSNLHEEIVKLTAEYGYITVDEVSMITGNVRHAYSVLQYLSAKGTLGTFSTHLRPSRAYYLPDDMKKILDSSGKVGHVENFYPYSYRPTGFYHHTSLIKTQLAIEKIFGDRLVEYFTELRLKRDYGKQKICDGEFLFLNKNNEKRKIGVEVELTLKSADVRHIKMENLFSYAKDNLSIIFMFFNKAIVRDRTKETICKCTSKETPVFFFDLDDFLSNLQDTKAGTIDGNYEYILRGV